MIDSIRKYETLTVIVLGSKPPVCLQLGLVKWYRIQLDPSGFVSSQLQLGVLNKFPEVLAREKELQHLFAYFNVPNETPRHFKRLIDFFIYPQYL